MRIRAIENEQEFLEIKEDWNRLAIGLSPFNDFDWMYKWWQYFKGKNNLKILVVEKNSRITGIAPLYLKNIRVLKVLPFKKLCFLGENLSDYLDFLLDSEYKEETFEQLINYIINKLDYDFLELGQLNSKYPNFTLWQKYTENLKLEFVSNQECPRILLTNFASYDDFYKKMNKNLKGSIKFRQGKVRKHGINLEYIFKNEITEKDIGVISKISLKRQVFLYKKGDNKRFCYFVDKTKKNFIRDYFCSTNSENTLLAYAVCNGEVVAYDLALLSKDTMYLWNAAFDPDYDMYSPLKLLINELLKYAFENNFKYFDFLRGKDRYKLEWTDNLSLNYKITRNNSAISHISHIYNNITPKFLLDLLREPSKEILQNNLNI
ncbi:MAG: hypothetical protein A2104_05155 [Candidatus Melainabacteria bacterium GWF2_32_7]|nr:MAG: hypothetical protein A2104_05155 [Candidatus Melainabacteria bacterium GWF2_32_7]